MTYRRPLVVAMTLVTMFGMVGCASKTKMTGAKMCEAHGGKYNSSAQQCSYSTPMMTGKQICENHTGYWDKDAQICEF